jgi:hypothetical protein
LKKQRENDEKEKELAAIFHAVVVSKAALRLAQTESAESRHPYHEYSETVTKIHNPSACRLLVSFDTRCQTHSSCSLEVCTLPTGIESTEDDLENEAVESTAFRLSGSVCATELCISCGTESLREKLERLSGLVHDFY